MISSLPTEHVGREVVVKFTQRLHAAQLDISRSEARHRVLVCGRRMGKTTLVKRIGVKMAAHGKTVRYFYPTNGQMREVWDSLKSDCGPITARRSETDHMIYTITGGIIRMNSLHEPEAIRGGAADLAILDEASLVDNLQYCWDNIVRPCLTDRRGKSLWCFTPKGKGFAYTVYSRGMDEDNAEWQSWHLPTSANPHISRDELEIIRRETPEKSWRQEYLAEFIEDGGGYFSGVAACIDKGRTQSSAPERMEVGGGYVMGLDLARKSDYTVMSVLDHTGKQVFFRRVNGMSWGRQFELITEAASQYNAHITMDSTGIGDVIHDDLVRRFAEFGIPVSVEPFVFTNSSKESILEELALRIERRTLSLMDIPVQTHELDVYTYDYNTRTRRVTSGAPEGSHDDTVMALALAVHGLPRAQPAKLLVTTHRPQSTRRNAY